VKGIDIDDNNKRARFELPLKQILLKVSIVEMLTVTFSDLTVRNMEAITDAIKDGGTIHILNS
jgi:hypothetical protein